MPIVDDTLDSEFDLKLNAWNENIHKIKKIMLELKSKNDELTI